MDRLETKAGGSRAFFDLQTQWILLKRDIGSEALLECLGTCKVRRLKQCSTDFWLLKLYELDVCAKCKKFSFSVVPDRGSETVIKIFTQ